MLFKEFFNEEEGYALFLNLFHHLDDEHIVLVFCDWLEENEFPNVASFIRNAPNNGIFFPHALKELIEKNIDVSDGIIYYDGKDTYKIKITPNEIQVAVEDGRWDPAPEEIIKKAFPGLAVSLFRFMPKNAENQFYRIAGRFRLEIAQKWISLSYQIINNQYNERRLDDTTIEILTTLINDTERFFNWIKGRNVNVTTIRRDIEGVIGQIEGIYYQSNYIEERNTLQQLLRDLLGQMRLTSNSSNWTV